MKGLTKLFFDWQKNRYYEKVGTDICYAFQHEKIENISYSDGIEPNRSFNEPSKEELF